MTSGASDIAAAFSEHLPDADSQGLFLKLGLYSSVPISIIDAKFVEKTRTSDVQFDCYCFWCKQQSTFRYAGARGSPSGRASKWALDPGIFSVELSCSRFNAHKYLYVFKIEDSAIFKIGQFPSLEDISGSDVIRFKNILRSDLFADLRRAGGLFSHGIGAGSFIYLRRVFEQLIKDAHAEAQKSSIDLVDFDRSRMSEKIRILSDFLPQTLVRNREIYGILSTGVHELNEETCLRYFPVVKAAIFQILEQHLQEKEKRRAEQELENEIKKISLEIGKL